jgi:hypothetical protein
MIASTDDTGTLKVGGVVTMTNEGPETIRAGDYLYWDAPDRDLANFTRAGIKNDAGQVRLMMRPYNPTNPNAHVSAAHLQMMIANTKQELVEKYKGSNGYGATALAAIGVRDVIEDLVILITSAKDGLDIAVGKLEKKSASLTADLVNTVQFVCDALSRESKMVPNNRAKTHPRTRRILHNLFKAVIQGDKGIRGRVFAKALTAARRGKQIDVLLGNYCL